MYELMDDPMRQRGGQKTDGLHTDSQNNRKVSRVWRCSKRTILEWHVLGMEGLVSKRVPTQMNSLGEYARSPPC
jgi:hypothetical protein